MTARLSAASGDRERSGRYLRDRFDFAAISDRVRMPWRFLARHMAVDGDLRR
jgi:hypothetical protein